MKSSKTLTQKCYEEKLKVIENADSCSIPESDFPVDIDNFSALCYPQILNYLVLRPSPFSADGMRACKSLEAYSQDIEGWVRDVKVLAKSSGLKVVKGKVNLLITLMSLIIIYGFPVK